MNEELFNRIKGFEVGYYDVYFYQVDISLNGNLLKVKYRAHTNGGGSLRVPYIMTSYYDIRTGEKYEIGSMFKKDIHYKAYLVTKVTQLYEQKDLLKLMWAEDDISEFKTSLIDSEFYIGEDEIIITEFPDGSSNQLICYEELKVPYSEIMDSINTESEL